MGNEGINFVEATTPQAINAPNVTGEYFLSEGNFFIPNTNVATVATAEIIPNVKSTFCTDEM